MDGNKGRLAEVAHFIHKHFLWLMIGSYGIAACLPAPGLWMRDLAIEGGGIFGIKAKVSLPMLMLASLLLNAGLGVEWDRARAMLRRPGLVGAGLAANLFIPILFILGVTRMLEGWHNADEVQNILVGLALVASMPIAGSSTAWAQNADGSLALSLGLVLLSTLLSPLTTPLALHSVGLMATGEYARSLHTLAAGGTGVFLTTCVLAPSILGIGLRRAIGETRYAAAKPRLKLVNSVVLLLLNYSNAAVSLPRAIADPDLDFLAMTLVIVVALCGLAFVAGWGISRVLGASSSERASLMFGLGMNNNGTGLVLASLALADHPRVMLPIIFYNLVRHLAAGLVDRLVSRPTPPPSPPRSAAPRPLGVMRPAAAR